MLREFEWKRISEILLQIYDQDSTMQIETSFLKSLQSLIRFDQSNFRVFDPVSGHEYVDNAIFLGINDKAVSSFYDNIVIEKDYLSNYYTYDCSLVYCHRISG